MQQERVPLARSLMQLGCVRTSCGQAAVRHGGERVSRGLRGQVPSVLGKKSLRLYCPLPQEGETLATAVAAVICPSLRGVVWWVFRPTSLNCLVRAGVFGQRGQQLPMSVCFRPASTALGRHYVSKLSQQLRILRTTLEEGTEQLKTFCYLFMKICTDTPTLIRLWGCEVCRPALPRPEVLLHPHTISEEMITNRTLLFSN